MTTYQKQAIMVLMNLYDDNHIDEEQYFLLLDFVISDTRNEIKISEYPWYELKPPFDMPITVMYGCGTDAITYAQYLMPRGRAGGEEIDSEVRP